MAKDLDLEMQREWTRLVSKLEIQFGEGLELDSIIFLIGVQELGQGHRKFKKNEKVDLMHIAICALLSRYGYYEYNGLDSQGWPHWKTLKSLPKLGPKSQSRLMKEAILEYFREADYISAPSES